MSLPRLGETYGIPVFVLGLVVFSYGLSLFFRSNQEEKPQLLKTSLTERDAAIYGAQINGSKTYHFETSFIPGIGPASEAIKK